MRAADGESSQVTVVSRVPLSPSTADDARATRTQARWLERLAGVSLPFRVPRVLGLYDAGDRLVVVESFCPGIPLVSKVVGDLDPVAILGRIAARLHAVGGEDWGEGPGGPACDRRSHVSSLLDAVALDAPPAFDGALGFVRDHLPEGPGVLLHGDLLPQNVHVDLLDGDVPAVLDWQASRVGDPAYDLAIVTRGVRRPLRARDGRRRLLAVYNEHARRPITLTGLRVHELCLQMAIYQQLVADGASPAHRAEQVTIVKGILERTHRGEF